MDINEFKAWFEGYSAHFKDGAPDAEQWEEVSKRIKAIRAPFTQPFQPYQPRPGDTMTKPVDTWPARPYYTPTDARKDWPFLYPFVTC